LNIGGTRFETSMETITKLSLFFQSMFCGRYDVKKVDDGSYFIDRDPTHFQFILNFMRDGILPNKINPDIIDIIIQEAQYYSMDSLINALKKKKMYQ